MAHSHRFIWIECGSFVRWYHVILVGGERTGDWFGSAAEEKAKAFGYPWGNDETWS